ncbi:LCP family protein [Actinosynnema sp. NPDC050436]|uniref:LCP family protein n=1 Tax=Actinosynnema sp. NPDC050436 TaxID=3155659 RepID=UPI0033DB4F65
MAGRTGPARGRPPKSGSLVGRTVAAFCSAVVLLGTGYAWSNFQSLTENLATTDVIGEDAGERPADGSIDILMVGMDSRTDAKGNPLPQHVLDELQAGDESAGGLNTDTLILLHIPNDTGKAVAVSFPRDAYVKIAGGYGRHKINSAYGYAKNDALEDLRKKGVTDPAQVEQESKKAGAKNLIDTIEGLTGVKIDHYAEINLVGFYDITKAVGGVDVCLNEATQDDFSGADFAAGPQTIEGRAALAFVRQRHGLLRGDLDRIVRQQVFMAGLAKKMLSAGTLSDPGKLRALIDALTKSIVLDKNWDVFQFANQMKNLSGGNIAFETIPTGNPELDTPEDGQAIEIIESDVKKFFKQLNGTADATTPTTAAVDPATVTVEVRNASGTPGLAGRVLESLVAKKYLDGGAANADPASTSVVRFGSGGEAGADAVAEVLGGLKTQEDGTIPAGRVRVIVGSDYSGPGAQNLRGTPLVNLDGARRQPATTTEAPITADGVRCIN